MSSTLDFNIEVNSSISNNFRVKKIMADYDLQFSNISETFEGSIELPDEWQIGVIYGSSGTGKSTIVKQIFEKHIKNYKYDDKSVIENMPDLPVEDIQKIFYSVGFGSVPSWLKPYYVLSNGEKMRVDLARALLEDDFIVFDEFTSVVDRQVANTMCIALEKAIRRTNKKIVLVTCHSDILEWLEADWIFNTNIMSNETPKKKEKASNLQLKNVQEMNGQSLGNITI